MKTYNAIVQKEEDGGYSVSAPSLPSCFSQGDNFEYAIKNIKEAIKKASGTNYFCGVDLGRSDDYTVVTIIDQFNNEVVCERWRHLEWSTIISNIVKLLNKYKPNVLIESNGAQDAIYEQIKNKVKDKVKSLHCCTGCVSETMER